MLTLAPSAISTSTLAPSIGAFTAPLLAVTARADADAERLAREAGFDGFLRKPVTGQMLASAIESALGDFDPVQDAAT